MVGARKDGGSKMRVGGREGTRGGRGEGREGGSDDAMQRECQWRKSREG